MRQLPLRALRVVIALALAGSVLVQLVMVPLLWADLDGAPPRTRLAVTVVVVLGVLSLQVVGVCLWRLLALVRSGTVFSPAAFRYVDVVIVAICTVAVAAFALAVTLAPGEAVAPGVVGLLCGLALVVGGVALLVVVMRALLVQAIALDTTAQHLRSELDEVI